MHEIADNESLMSDLVLGTYKKILESELPARPKVPGMILHAQHKGAGDSAFWVEKKGTSYTVAISMFDPIPYLGTSAELDNHVLRQGLSRSRGVEYLYPYKLIIGCLGLVPHEARLGITITLQVDRDGQMKPKGLFPSAVRVNDELTYAEADNIIEDTHHPLSLQLRHTLELTRLLERERRTGGALSIFNLRHGIATHDGGELYYLDPQKTYQTTQIKREMRYLAGVICAELLTRKNIPAVYIGSHLELNTVDWIRLRSEIEAKLGEAESVDIFETNMFIRRAVSPLTISSHPVKAEVLGLPAFTPVTGALERMSDWMNILAVDFLVQGEVRPYPVDLETVIQSLKREYHTPKERMMDTLHVNSTARADADDLRLPVFRGDHPLQLSNQEIQALYEKIDHEKITTLELYALLFTVSPPGLRPSTLTWVFSWLYKHPKDAVGIISLARLHRHWPFIRYETLETTLNSKPVYRVRANIKIRRIHYISDWVEARTKKAGRELACVGLLEKYFT